MTTSDTAPSLATALGLASVVAGSAALSRRSTVQPPKSPVTLIRHRSPAHLKDSIFADTMAVQKYDIRRPASEGGGFEERFWSSVNSPVLRPDGTLAYIIHRVEDVTEVVRLTRREHELLSEERSRQLVESADDVRRLNEALERRATQLMSANLELEAFAYSVSHDLRAPLRSIDGFSQALVEDAGPALPEDARRHLDRIRAATLRMSHLIDDMLALSKVSRAEMKRTPVDLSDLAARTVAALRHQAPTRDVTVTIAPDMTAEGDARLLRVALENLLDNAWKFTSRRDRPQIEVGRMSGQDAAPIFFVRDNGTGFDPAYADKLFGPFERLHAASDYPGTGIGLATVQRIVHRHGGRVWAEAEPNRGACFYFTLG